MISMTISEIISNSTPVERRVDPRRANRLPYSSVSIDREFFVRVIELLVRTADTSGRDAAMDLLNHRFTSSDDAQGSLADPQVRELAWETVSAPTFPRESYHWEVIVSHLAQQEPERAAKAAIDAMRRPAYQANQSGQKVAISVLQIIPDVIVDEFIRLVADVSAVGPLVHSYRDFVAQIPPASASRVLKNALCRMCGASRVTSRRQVGVQEASP